MDATEMMNATNDRVRALHKEAIRADPQTFRKRGEWLKKKVLACQDDQRSLEDLRQLVGRLPWSYKPTVIEIFQREISDEQRCVQEFDAVRIETPIEKAKRRWPIKRYCEEILHRKFKHNKCQCPLHDGDSEPSFVVDEKFNRWFCFGNCPHDPGKDYRSGDVVDLHRLLHGFQNESEAVKDLLSSRPTKPEPQSVAPGQHLFFSLAKPEPEKTDAKLIAKVLAASAQVTRASIQQASSLKPACAWDFGDWLLRLQESVDGHLVVARTKYEALVGLRARRAIAKAPYRLQYLCCATAKTESQHKTEENLNVERPLFLNVEFDHETAENQLKILWWLKTVRQWKLVSLTWSGSKSWHGLFDVRQVEAQRLRRMRELAKSLGACSMSLAPTAWVRFPGGTRTDETWQQKPIAKQEIIWINRC